MLRRGCSGPPKTPPWGPMRNHCVNGFAGGSTVAGCSGSAVIVTGATNTAVSAAGRERAGNKFGPPSGNTRKARRDGPIPAIRPPSISSTAFSMTTSAAAGRRSRNTGRAASGFSARVSPTRPSPPTTRKSPCWPPGITLEELRVENVILRIQANPAAPHGAVADFVLVRTRQEQEVSREQWTATMQLVFMPVIPADLVIFNPMGIQVTYLETDRALITETP